MNTFPGKRILCMAPVAAAAMLWNTVAQTPPPAAPAPVSAPADTSVAAPALPPPAATATEAAPAPATSTSPEAVVTPAPAGETAVKDTGLVTLTVSDAKIQDVLRSLAATRDVNIIMGPEVQGSVSFALKDVPWDLALELVTKSNGYQVVRESDKLYRVIKSEAVAGKEAMVEMLAKADVKSVPPEDLLRLARAYRPDVDWTVDLARAEIEKNVGRFVRSIQVENRAAIDVISELAKKAGLNYAFAGDTKGTAAAPGAAPTAIGQTPITMHFTYLQVEDALRLVAAQGNLQCVQQNGVWTVKAVPPQQVQQEPLRTETIQVKFLPVDDDLLKTLKQFLTARGNISFNKNKLILRDTAESIESVRNALVVMDVPTPQVLIEARFFQLSDGFSRNLGIDWSELGTTGLATATLDGSQLKYLGEYNYTKLLSSSPNGTNYAFTRDATLTATLSATQAEGVIKMLEGNNNAKQIANPKVVVSSDQQAMIHIGDQKPIIKTTVSQGTGPSVTTVELDGDFGGETVQEEVLLPSGATQNRSTRTYTARKGYLDLGTRLTVAPSVKTEEQIYIKVVPELTTNITPKNSTDVYPTLHTTMVKTEFTIRSGQTVAIGGLSDETETTDIAKIPFLGDIPYIGNFFSYNTTEKKKSETVIFLTVTLVSPEKMTATSGIPVRSAKVQPEVERIQSEDAAGAEYRSSRAIEENRKEKAEKDKPLLKKWFGKAEAEEPVKTMVAEPVATPPPPVPATPPPAAMPPAAAPEAETAPSPAK